MREIRFNKSYIGVLFFVLYVLSSLINNIFSFPLEFFGFILLIYIVPQSILRILKIQNLTFLESILASITTYFVIFVPSYLTLTTLGLPIGKWQIFSLILTLFIIYFFSAKQEVISISPTTITRWIQDNIPLLIALAVFAGVHILNFHFYHYIPEGDGYLDMIRIEKAVEVGHITTQYRTLFALSMSLFSAFGNISPYSLFSFWILAIETTGIISLYLLTKRYHVKDRALQLLILLSILSIPVLNMETDYVRPQTILIILLPIYLYFLHVALQSKSLLGWSLSTGIAIVGIGYHQFFLFIILTHGLLLFLHLCRKYLYDDKKNRIIFMLGCAFSISIFFNAFLLFLKNSSFFQESFYYIGTIITTLQQLHWRWWFLSHYPAEAQSVPMGWSGIFGTLQFYGYYGGPIIFLIFLIIFYFFYKYKLTRVDSFAISLLPLLFLTLFFAEILPRLNRPLIPERFWLLIDILLIFLSIPLWKKLPSLFKKELVYYTLIFAILLGMSSSFYVAHRKMGTIISENDILATPWIQTYTESDAVFISQASNDALFAYFFKRKLLSALPREQWVDVNIKDTYRNILKSSTENIPDSPSCSQSMNLLQANECIIKLKSFVSAYNIHEEDKVSVSEKLSSPLYIYYSEDRFHNIFNEREWWRIKNYADIDLEKLNALYALVYNKNGVYIWKVN